MANEATKARTISNKTLGSALVGNNQNITGLGNISLGSGTNKGTIQYSTNTTRTFTIPNPWANADFVMNQWAQNIAGVKTFSSSPIVPTPTTDMQVATKKYVDDNAGGDFASVGISEAGSDPSLLKTVWDMHVVSDLFIWPNEDYAATHTWVEDNFVESTTVGEPSGAMQVKNMVAISETDYNNAWAWIKATTFYLVVED